MTQSAGLHEPEERLSPQTVDRHRALAAPESLGIGSLKGDDA
jgi:hypothetical protein